MRIFYQLLGMEYPDKIFNFIRQVLITCYGSWIPRVTIITGRPTKTVLTEFLTREDYENNHLLRVLTSTNPNPVCF